MADIRKRKVSPPVQDNSSKKPKIKKQWQTPKSGNQSYNQGPVIEPGDSGIWATCDMGREAKCVGELTDLFQEYAEKIYGDQLGQVTADAGENSIDIETEINNEINTMQRPNEEPLFTPVRLDVRCVMFFKTRQPVEPVSFVHTICKDAAASGLKRTRFVKRLTPMTIMGKATESGLGEVAKTVIAPYFHKGDGMIEKFAIRPSFRNHSKPLARDPVIKQIADAVGSPHKVDLKHYDRLILMEVYQNICGMSVVGSDYDELKRYNLAEIYQPSQLDVIKDNSSDAPA